MTTSDESVYYLFVYGTLMSVSEHRMAHYLRQHTAPVSEGSFPGRLYHFGSYPGAVYETDAPARVYGEVYSFGEAVSAQLFATLDQYEGDEYVRAVVPVQTRDAVVNCWTYLFVQSTQSAQLIESGRFR